LKRIASISAIFLIVLCIIAVNIEGARPTSKTTPQETVSPEALGAAVVKTIKVSGSGAGNKRYPGVAENADGDRLVIFRGSSGSYMYTFCRKGGSWSNPAVIPNQPKMKSSTCTDVEVDSTGRFHCLWEDTDKTLFYASYLDGKWTNPVRMSIPGRNDMGGAIAVRSNDEVVIAAVNFVKNPTNSKEIYLYFKGKKDTHFKFKNITNDRESSTTPSVAVDSNDDIWVALKSDLNLRDMDLITVMHHLDKNNSILSSKTLSVEGGWNFWPQIAVNSEDKVMATWVLSQSADYFSRLYNPKTKNWSSIERVLLGAPMKPWAAFWSKLAAHGKDFYLAAMNSGRYLHLMKYNEKTHRWTNFAKISDDPVYYFDLYPGYDQMLIVWDNDEEPSNIYLTTVDVPPVTPTTNKSKISGTVRKDSKGLSGVTMTGLPGNPATDSSGEYSGEVENGWGGTVRPQKSGYAFSPSSITYTNVTSNQTDQDYLAFIAIKSVANLQVEKRVERGFFNSYTLNILTWEANPENTALGLVISAQRVYRKSRTEDNSKWARIAELAGSVRTYEDRNVPSDSDYVYAVTCVDDKGNESAIY